MTKLKLHAEARQELAEAARRYKEIDDALGRDFLAEFRRVRRYAEEFPEAGTIVAKRHGVTIHRFLFDRRFPFKLLIAHSDKEHVILAVAHSRQHPAYWRDRLEP